MPEPVTIAALVAKWGPWIAKNAAKAIVGELAKSFFFGSDKKKLKKALEEISRALARIEKKLDEVYDLVKDISKSVEEIKAISLEIPDLTNFKKAHAVFAAVLSKSMLSIGSEESDDGTPGKDTTVLKLWLEDVRTARDEYIGLRRELGGAIHASALEILVFFYSDLQITLAFVSEIWGDGDDYGDELKKYLTEFVRDYEPILLDISNPDGNGSLDIHLSQINHYLKSIEALVRPAEGESVVSSFFLMTDYKEFKGYEGEVMSAVWRDVKAVTVAKKSVDMAILSGRPLIGVDWLQYLYAERRGKEKFGTDTDGTWEAIDQSRLAHGDAEFKTTELSQQDIDHFLGLFRPISKAPSKSLPLIAASEFLFRVERHNADSSMAAMLEDLKSKVSDALSIVQDSNFPQADHFHRLRTIS